MAYDLIICAAVSIQHLHVTDLQIDGEKYSTIAVKTFGPPELLASRSLEFRPFRPRYSTPFPMFATEPKFLNGNFDH